MGKGIARMLLQEQTHQNFPLDLWIYDPYLPAETQCQNELIQSKIPGTLRSLRECFSPSDNKLVSKLQPDGQPGELAKASDVISNAVNQIAPRLILNAATYLAHQLYIPLARELGCDYLDLGQNLPLMEDLAATDAAIAKKGNGTRIIQEIGLAPGLANILAVSMYQKAKEETTGSRVHSVQMRVGGLPQHTSKGGKLHYGPTFSPEGLLFEYEKIAYGLREGQVVTPSTFTHPEYWESASEKPLPFGITPFEITDSKIQTILTSRVEPEFLSANKDQLHLKNLEARPTADGTSRMCFDERFQSNVSHLEYKTLRFASHYETWTEFQKTRRLTSTLAHWKQHINDPNISGYPDLILLRVWAQATPKSTPHAVTLVALHDDVPVGSPNGFTAMQHLTGWPTVLLAFSLLKAPAQSEIHQPLDSQTAFGRTIEDVLKIGGIIAPFELVNGMPFLEEITQKDRIPLCQVKLLEGKASH